MKTSVNLRFIFLVLVLGWGLFFQSAHAAVIEIENLDNPGEGFNDPTPVAPVGNNPGTTLGEQRLILFQAAADAWGAVLESDVTIQVGAFFQSLPCEPPIVNIGRGGTTQIFRDFPNAPHPGTWYHGALASALTGVDLVGEDIDIITLYNMDFDKGCAGDYGFYYGMDGNPPDNTVDLYITLLHELAHGLGFQNFSDEETGELFMGYLDGFSWFAYDLDADKRLVDMGTPEEMAAAMKNFQRLAWTGENVTASASNYLSTGKSVFTVVSPEELTGDYLFSKANFGADITEPGIENLVELADDGTGNAADACESLVGFTPGRIALIDRGDCTFVQKAENAAAAGASGVIIVNVSDPAPMGMSGESEVQIPVVGIGRDVGNNFKERLSIGVEVALYKDTTGLIGTDEENRVLLYTPDPIEPGSSMSHFDSSCSPSLLMEPFVENKKVYSLDLTVAALADLGWPLNAQVRVPEIKRFWPSYGVSGRKVTIFGTGFSEVEDVRFGQTSAARFEIISDRQITAITGNGETGTVKVFTPASAAESPGEYTYDTSEGAGSGGCFIDLLMH